MTNEELAANIVELRLKVDNNAADIKDIKQKQDDFGQLLTTLQVFKVEQDHMKTDISEIKETVKTIAEKPAKRWDLVVTTAIGALAGAFVGWAMAGFPGI